MSWREDWQHFTWRKQKLMDDLNHDRFDATEWRRFIKEAGEAGMKSMSENMQRRFDNYEKEKNE
jgi:hypothetical protein